MNTIHHTARAPHRAANKPRSLAAIAVALVAATALPQVAAAQAPAYDITFKNLTSNAVATGAATDQTGQRLSPPVFVTHSADYTAYTVGQAAPETIWRIAEGGDRSFLLGEVNALVGTKVLSVAAPLSAPLPQQDSVTVRVQADASHRFLSFASMLGWTNDGFVGVSGLDLSAITGTVTINLYGYDAGSEKNNEANGFLGALGAGNARDPEGGLITSHLGIRGDVNAPASWNWLPGPAASLTISAVPEPTTWALLAGGLPLIHLLRRRARAGTANQA
ncbi:MAG: PEP-CTERM sorting domain-containing protein [Rubrivivax sp.]|nr:MAG: PEP-CTERM sorting domain-containing protein [Rubrivivax sp.]